MEAVERLPSVRVLPSGLVSRRDAAAFLGCDPKTLMHWSRRSYGPVVKKVGGRAFYAFADVQAFATGQTREGASA